MHLKSKKKNKLEFSKEENESRVHNNDSRKKTTNIDSPVNNVFYGVMVVMGVIIISGIVMFVMTYRYEVKYSNFHDEWMKKRESIYSEEVISDSVLSKITKKEAGKYLIPLSEVSKIRESQKLIIRRQDQLIDDIRQETNNIINKMNGWLGFWVSGLGILGVFVPIALQFKLYRETRDYDNKLREEYQKEINRYAKAQRIAQANLDAKLLKIEVEIDKQFNRLQENYRRDIENTKFTVLIKCFHNIMISPVIRTNELRNQLLKRNWEEIVTNVGESIKSFTDTDIVDAYIMSVNLVHVINVLKSLKILIPWRNRQLESLIKESKNIIQDLNRIPQDRDTIIKQLINYHESLSNLHPL